MARTERAQYQFVVKEFGDGTPWITVEPRDPSRLSILENAVLGIHLKPGIDTNAAQQIVDSLNEHVANLSFTDLRDLPHAPGAD